jgi:hypothetical protein
MGRSCYIYTPEKPDISLEDVISTLQYYQEITAKTGVQLNWDYSRYAFPYVIEIKENNGDKYLLLKGQLDRYYAILIGVNASIENPYIQITLPNRSTFADKGKANEFAKFLAKKFNGKLTLFNGKMAQ